MSNQCDEEDNEQYLYDLENLSILEEKAKNQIAADDLPSTVLTFECFPPKDVKGFPSFDDKFGKIKPYGKVYIVGVTPYSIQSQNDVTETIQQTQPDIVMIQLCPSRRYILETHEEDLLNEEVILNTGRVQDIIRQFGIFHGSLYYLLLSLATRVTKHVGTSPGGEFRAACQEVENIPDCLFELGDRPFEITFQRAFNSLTILQKIRLLVRLLCLYGFKIRKQDIERARKGDLCEVIFKELANTAAVRKIFQEERDQYMAHKLRCLTQNVFMDRCQLLSKLHKPIEDVEKYPVTAVGIIGQGHEIGVAEYWIKSIDIDALSDVSDKYKWIRYMDFGIKMALIGTSAYILYKESFRLSSYLRR